MTKGRRPDNHDKGQANGRSTRVGASRKLRERVYAELMKMHASDGIPKPLADIAKALEKAGVRGNRIDKVTGKKVVLDAGRVGKIIASFGVDRGMAQRWAKNISLRGGDDGWMLTPAQQRKMLSQVVTEWIAWEEGAVMAEGWHPGAKPPKDAVFTPSYTHPDVWWDVRETRGYILAFDTPRVALTKAIFGSFMAQY